MIYSTLIWEGKIWKTVLISTEKESQTRIIRDWSCSLGSESETSSHIPTSFAVRPVSRITLIFLNINKQVNNHNNSCKLCDQHTGSYTNERTWEPLLRKQSLTKKNNYAVAFISGPKLTLGHSGLVMMLKNTEVFFLFYLHFLFVYCCLALSWYSEYFAQNLFMKYLLQKPKVWVQC